MITPKKNLRTGQPIWLSLPAPKLSFKALERDVTADVTIIGSGISGAMMAEELSSYGFSVVLLDRREPLKGATAATTALIQYEIDEPLIYLSKKIGEVKAIRAWRRSKLGLESLYAKIESLNIPCDLERKHSLYLAGNVLNAEALQQECSVRNAVGLYTEYLSRSVLAEDYGIHKQAALRTYSSLSLNPRKLAAQLLLIAINHDARIYSPVNVLEVFPLEENVQVVTEAGPKITSRFVIFTTGYEIPKYMKTRKHSIHSTWAIATKPQPRALWPEECFIWEASDPYLYMRTTPEGRVICGGEDEEFENEEKRDALLKQKAATLEKKLAALFPQLDPKAEFAWTGSFGGSTTGLPTIGAIPGMKHCFGVMAFGGNGITYSRIAAELVTSRIRGLQDPDEDLYAFL